MKSCVQLIERADLVLMIDNIDPLLAIDNIEFFTQKNQGDVGKNMYLTA